MPKLAIAGTRDPRLLTVILRGGLDGLALAAPAGDPDFARLRGSLAIPASGEGAGHALDALFVLNPSMPNLASLYAKKEALIAHAVATPYRERSHFDGQDVLESGLPGVGRADTGWLNRALAGLTAAPARRNPKGLAMGAVVPLAMRGAAPVLSWIPKTYGADRMPSTVARLMDLYTHTDPALAKAFADGVEIEKVGAASGMAQGGAAGRPVRRSSSATSSIPRRRPRASWRAPTARASACSSYNGWDTHANEGALKGQLANRLGGLDRAIKAFADGMGAAWKDTVVVVVTEFGRTVRVNGTEGTDHGTATVALVLGGAVNGGRMLADWPGLSEQALHQGRDLKPTLDLRSVLKGVLRDHLGIPAGALAEAVFPSSAAIAPREGLLA